MERGRGDAEMRKYVEESERAFRVALNNPERQRGDGFSRNPSPR